MSRSVSSLNYVSVSDGRVNYYRMNIMISRTIEETVSGKMPYYFVGPFPAPSIIENIRRLDYLNHLVRKILVFLCRCDIVIGLISTRRQF